MAWIEDLKPCQYLDDFVLPSYVNDYDENPLGEKLLAVGWLERAHPYARGKVPKDVVRKLFELLRDPWNAHWPSGYHQCSLCTWGTPLRYWSVHGVVEMGVSNLFVPGPSVIYAAPSLIIHYISAHRYLPPARFSEALLACPPMGSDAYFQAMTLAAGPSWQEFFAKQRQQWRDVHLEGSDSVWKRFASRMRDFLTGK